MESIPGKLPQMDGWAQNGWFSDDSLHKYQVYRVFVLYIYEYVLHDRTIKMLMIWIFHQFQKKTPR